MPQPGHSRARGRRAARAVARRQERQCDVDVVLGRRAAEREPQHLARLGLASARARARRATARARPPGTPSRSRPRCPRGRAGTAASRRPRRGTARARCRAAGRPDRRAARRPGTVDRMPRTSRSRSAASRCGLASRSASASSAATANAAAPATSWVPARRPRCCPPPCSSGVSGAVPRRRRARRRRPGRRSCAPRRSARRVPAAARGIRPPRAERHRHVPERGDGVEVQRHAGDRGRLGEPCRVVDRARPRCSRRAPSRAPRRRARRRKPARRSARARRAATGRTTAPSCGREPLDGVEGRVVLAVGQDDDAVGRRLRAHHSPLSARLIDSVPPEVKTTSMGSQSSTAARRSRDSSSSRRAAWPAPWIDEALPDDVGRLEPGVARLGAQRGRRGVIEVDRHRAPPPVVTRSDAWPYYCRTHAPHGRPPPRRHSPGLLSSELDDLGVTLRPGRRHPPRLVGRGDPRSSSSSSTTPTSTGSPTNSPLEPVGGGVWQVTTPLLRAGHALRGPRRRSARARQHLQPRDAAPRALLAGSRRAAATTTGAPSSIDGSFDWGGVAQARASRSIAPSSTKAI